MSLKREWHTTDMIEVKVTPEELAMLGINHNSSTHTLELNVEHKGYYIPAKITADPYYSEPEEVEDEIIDIEYAYAIGDVDIELTRDDVEIILDSPCLLNKIQDELKYY